MLWFLFWLFVIFWGAAHGCAAIERSGEALEAAKREARERENIARQRARAIEMRAKHPLPEDAWTPLPGDC